MGFTDGFIKILDALCDKVGIAVDWTSDMVSNNIVPYINQLAGRIVNFEIATSVVWILVWGVVFFVGKKVKKTAKEWDEDASYYDDYSILWLLGLGISAMAIIFAITEVMDIVTALTLPEKTLLDFTKTIIEN